MCGIALMHAWVFLCMSVDGRVCVWLGGWVPLLISDQVSTTTVDRCLYVKMKSTYVYPIQCSSLVPHFQNYTLWV